MGPETFKESEEQKETWSMAGMCWAMLCVLHLYHKEGNLDIIRKQNGTI